MSQGRGERWATGWGGGWEWAVRLEGEGHDADRLLRRSRTGGAWKVFWRELGPVRGGEVGTEVDGAGCKVICRVELRIQRDGRPKDEVAEGRCLLRRDRRDGRDRSRRRLGRGHRCVAWMFHSQLSISY